MNKNLVRSLAISESITKESKIILKKNSFQNSSFILIIKMVLEFFSLKICPD